MKRVMCIPNYSEGRDLEKVEKIADCFRAKEGLKLVDYQPDKDHNRTVVEVIGEPKAVMDAVIASVKVAQEVIDMTKHSGGHPRMGAVDVVPFIPITECTTEECVEYAKEVGKAIGELGIPVYLYQNLVTGTKRLSFPVTVCEYGMFTLVQWQITIDRIIQANKCCLNVGCNFSTCPT